MSTNLLDYGLESAPVVEHAHEETDEVDDGEGTEEERQRQHSLVIDLPKDGLDGVSELSVVRDVEELGLEGFPGGEIGEDEPCSLVGVVQECPHLAAQTLHHLVTQLPPEYRGLAPCQVGALSLVQIQILCSDGGSDLCHNSNVLFWHYKDPMHM